MNPIFYCDTKSQRKIFVECLYFVTDNNILMVISRSESENSVEQRQTNEGGSRYICWEVNSYRDRPRKFTYTRFNVIRMCTSLFYFVPIFTLVSLLEPAPCEMVYSKYGCCWDNWSIPKGPNGEGCPGNWVIFTIWI